MLWLRSIALCTLAAAISLPVDAADKPAGEKARLVLKVPASAQVLLDGKPTKQTGEERTYLSGALASGKFHTFKITASWTQNGNPHKVSRSVKIKAGAREVVDLRLTDIPAIKKPKKAPETKKETKKTDEAKKRNFQFNYATTVTGLKPGQKARIWLPIAQSSADQDVFILSKDVPSGSRIEKETTYGNQLLYVEAAANDDGKIPLQVSYKVMRREVKGEASKEMMENAELLRRYLQADAMVPLEGKPLDLIKDRELPKDQKLTAKTLYDVVNDHMRYSKEGTGWGRGDSVWACDSKYGNCTDFHSLFISLARSQKIPAKFEIGFPLPEKHGEGDIAGYHCWAKFKPDGRGWVPVDISEANKNPKLKDYYFGNLTEDRVTFTTGRDLTLSPKQDGPPVNFLVYPYVEVDGKVYPKEKLVNKFSFKDE